MKLLIVSGLSGAGKSIVLDTLEDCGFYCIDNLPINLMDDFIDDEILPNPELYNKTALGIDVRNQPESLLNFSESITAIHNKGLDCKVFFLQAEESVLLKRYSETRRKHPLTDRYVALQDALKIEKDMLEPIAKHADVILDTSHTHRYQLTDLIKQYLNQNESDTLSLQLQSFGYKNGIPLDADFVFDARCLPNPFWEPELRGFSGKDPQIVDYLRQSDIAEDYLQDLILFLDKWLLRFKEDNRSYLTVAIGCTGGQHRSVYLVESLGQYFKKQAVHIILRHRELL